LKLTRLIIIAFSLLAGILVVAIWSNVQVYAQQQLSHSPAAGSGSVSKSISLELKSKICDPSNPGLKVVNTTEARICGIPKTVKPPLASAATPQIPAVSSSSPAQQTVISKPTAANITAPKQQQIVTTNAVSPSIRYVTWATIASLSNPSNTSSPSSAIAPQIKAVNQQLQPLPLIPITAINSTAGTNGTAGQNYTFAATSPVASSDKLLYLGYHDNTKSSHGNSGSKHDDSTDSKPHTLSSTRTVTHSSSEDKLPHIKKIIATDNESTAKKTTSSTKVHRIDSTNDDPKPPKPHSTKTTSDGSSTTKKKISSTKLIRTADSGSDDKPKSDTKLPHIKKIIATDNESTANKKKSSSTSGESSSGYKKSPNTESSSDHAADSGTTGKKKTKSDIATTNDDSHSKKVKSSHTDDDSKSLSSDLGSAIRNKVDSIIRDSMGEVGHNLFGFSDNGGF
jgi:hypothetical protein